MLVWGAIKSKKFKRAAKIILNWFEIQKKYTPIIEVEDEIDENQFSESIMDEMIELAL